ncbi:hypothetical protein [Novosphingobium sp. ST904]|uniref:hypothetical protein n=1 Tax=Novosphingobium sp. ST904 TaxID=1684385 RepID=UPI000AF242AA|nr:hypothetical protein [Novosphingobium sp. ST904]
MSANPATNETLSGIAPCPADLRAALVAIVGPENVSDDEARLRLFSEDVWTRADHVAMLAVAPATTAELAAVVKAANEAGVALARAARA